MIPKSWWVTLLAGLIILATLPFAGRALRGDRQNLCDWDGLPLEPIYQVRIVEPSGSAARFCCLQCAESYLARHTGSALEILVTDEASGGELEASRALYVRSTVVTNPVTGNRCHVFRRREDAEKHVEAARGRLLLDDERPFANWNASQAELADD